MHICISACMYIGWKNVRNPNLILPCKVTLKSACSCIHPWYHITIVGPYYDAKQSHISTNESIFPKIDTYHGWKFVQSSHNSGFLHQETRKCQIASTAGSKRHVQTRSTNNGYTQFYSAVLGIIILLELHWSYPGNPCNSICENKDTCMNNDS